MTLLHLPDLYALDRLDVTGYGTVDTAAQKRVTDVLERLGDPAYVRSLGLVGHDLLGEKSRAGSLGASCFTSAAPSAITCASTRTASTRPDINSGAKLILGSTAKLRTLVTYLNIVDELHRKLAPLPRRDLVAMAAAKDDPITAWAAGYLAKQVITAFSR